MLVWLMWMCWLRKFGVLLKCLNGDVFLLVMLLVILFELLLMFVVLIE